MSSKAYREAHDYMTDKQIKAMWKLYQGGINHDGHSWVTFGDVEDAVAELLEKQIPKPKHKYMGWRCVCGEEVAKNQKYCEYCGQRLEDGRE